MWNFLPQNLHGLDYICQSFSKSSVFFAGVETKTLDSSKVKCDVSFQRCSANPQETFLLAIHLFQISLKAVHLQETPSSKRLAWDRSIFVNCRKTEILKMKNLLIIIFLVSHLNQTRWLRRY